MKIVLQCLLGRKCPKGFQDRPDLLFIATWSLRIYVVMGFLTATYVSSYSFLLQDLPVFPLDFVWGLAILLTVWMSGIIAVRGISVLIHHKIYQTNT